MTKQEQIEEMGKVMPEKIKDPLDNSRYIIYGKSLRREIARIYYNAGYRKLSEDSVVLSKEEYEKLKSLYDNQKGAYMTSNIGDLPLTVEGLRKAVDEITRLNRVEAELQELNIKYYNEAKDLRRELKQSHKEAVKEFAEKLKECAKSCEESGYDGIGEDDIDLILKEYEEL